MDTLLESFDGNEKARCELLRPDRYRALFDSFRSGPAIARGSGLSYCAASFGAGSKAVSTALFDRILSFDKLTGAITVEAGITLGQLFEFVIANGWYLPILPGHPSITVGGCIGFNVHGKSQFHAGNFENCVESFVLFHPDHGEINCSRSDNANLFKLTLGGFGLTGIVVAATLRLVRLQGKSIAVKRVPVKNLTDAVSKMTELKATFETVYSWNNLNLRDEQFGQGYVYAETFSDVELPEISSFNVLRPPCSQGRFALLNSLSSKAMCLVYGAKEKLGAREFRLGLKAGAFPINGKEIYYKLFGSRGFYEYQFIVSADAWPSVVRDVENLIAKNGAGISLGSLKLFSGKQRHLNFDDSGVCLAIDVPANERALKLFSDLDSVITSAKGTVNLSKDSRVSKTFAQKVFREFDSFKQDLHAFDPHKKMKSALRDRLDV